MVAQFSNTESFNLMFNDDFSEEKIQEYEASLDILGHISVHSIDRNNISHENLKKLYERIYLKRKNLELVLSADNVLDVSFLKDFKELEILSMSVHGKIINIDVLENLKNLKELHLDFHEQEDLEFLWNVNPNLEKLTVADSSKKKINLDLTPISQFKNLKYLYLREYNKNIESTVSQLTKLETLALRSISKPTNLDFISNLKNLKDLIVQLGSFDDVSMVATLKHIRFLQLWRLAKLKNIDFVREMSELQYLFIETLNGITKFPNIENLHKLRRIQANVCKNLTDFSEIEKSKSLTDFVTQNATNNITDFIPILKNPHIKDLGIGYQKVATQREVEKLAQQYNKEVKTYMYPKFKARFEYE